MSITVKNISDISYASFFYGMSRCAFLFYIANPPGFELSQHIAHEKWCKNNHKLFQKLHTEFLINLDYTESLELILELELSESVEFFTHEFFRICGVFDDGSMMTPISDRKFPVMPIDEETYMMYFIGMSWFLDGNTINRQEKIMNFLKTARSKLAPNISNQRLYKLYQISISFEILQDYREILYDIMQCTRIVHRGEK